MGNRGPSPSPLSTRSAGRKGNRRPDSTVPGRPSCPAWLSPEAKHEWRRVVPLLEDLSLLAKVDQALLAGYCQHRADWEKYAALALGKPLLTTTNQAGETVYTPNPLIALAENAYDRMVKSCREFGFSPGSRVGLKTPDRIRISTAPPPRPGAVDPRSVLSVVG